jgi:hypothetical protein
MTKVLDRAKKKDWRERTTVRVPELPDILDISRTTAYAAKRQGRRPPPGAGTTQIGSAFDIVAGACAAVIEKQRCQVAAVDRRKIAQPTA